jgi:predicted dehydrogenase
VLRHTVNKRLINLGLVGCGRISQAAHLPAIAKANNVRLSGVCDQSPSLAEAMARRYDVRRYSAVEDILNSDSEAVMLAVPDRLHVPLARAAIEAGKHVFVEKPLATNVSEAESLSENLLRSSVKLQVGNMKRFDPGVQFARDILERGGSERFKV